MPNMPKIVSTPTVIGGKKRISGTRISVDLVYDHMIAGRITQFRRNYPHITTEQLDTAIQYIIRTMNRQQKKLGTQALKV